MRSVARALPMVMFGLLSALQAAGAQTPAGAALVIGNSRYPGLPPLPACAGSAQVVSAALQRDGFAVTLLADASNGEMGAAIADFATRLASPPARAAVLYVCGYAAGYAGRTFLLPASADIQRESDLLTQGLVARSLINMLTRSAVPAGLILFDAVAATAATTTLGLDRLVAEPAQGGIGLAAAALAAPLPQGATRLAAGFAQELAAPRLETGGLLAALSAALGEALAVRAPAAPAWLLGGPPAAEPAPAPATPPEAAQTATLATPPPSAGQAMTMPDEAHMTEADRRHVQAALAKLGYYDGAVDGVFGPDTRAAIRRFQHEIGAAMDGRVKPEQAARLRAASP